MFLHCIFAAFSKKTNGFCQMFRKRMRQDTVEDVQEMEDIAQIGLCSFFFIPVKLCASIFHEFPSSGLCHRVNEVENVTEKQPEGGKKKTTKKHTERTSGWKTEAIINRFENTREKRYASNSFLFTCKETSQMKSALEDHKPFFG